MKVLVTLTLLVSVSFCTERYPGKSERPILSDKEAECFTKAKYLQGWTPPDISTDTAADYIVGKGEYKTVQAAVNAAVNDGGTVRRYIQINAGTYKEVVYIPRTVVPITLYGAGMDASSTVISLTLSAYSGGSHYNKLVDDLFSKGDPGYKTYSNCASKEVIGMECSSVVWVEADNVQIVNLTIQNLSKRPDDDQAVALYTQGDRTQVSNCRILGYQNTFWSGATGTTVSRGHVTNSYIEGDTDLVFGGGSTVFEGCTFYARSERTYAAVIFSPATAASHQYGYLVINSTITGDWNFIRSKGVNLARAWDFGVHLHSTYFAGMSPNGQLVVRDSKIDDVLTCVYVAATSSGRKYVGNNQTTRNLNDNRFNKFYEYHNTGSGA